MRVGNYVVRPDKVGWVLSTVKVYGEDSKKAGEEHETDITYPGNYAHAMRSLLDRMVKDGHDPGATLQEAVATVAHLYAKIGEEVR